jgi:hypothetical protein
VVQAGAFAEHDIATARYRSARPGWTGADTEYIHHEPVLGDRQDTVDAPWLDVELPPGTEITLTLALRTRVRPPSYRTPWIDPTV